MQRLHLMALVVLVFGIVLTMATASLAHHKPGHKRPPGQEECKPGWGYGDPNHPHCGPPGQRR